MLVMSNRGHGFRTGDRRVLVPRAAVIIAGFHEALWLSPDGAIEALAPAEARARVLREPPMLCHARATAQRLDMPGFAAFDLLELFAFVHPARFCVPTPRGLAEALGLPRPARPEDACVSLAAASRMLLEALGSETGPELFSLAETMERGGWPWAPAVLAEARSGCGSGRGSANGTRARRRRRPAMSRCVPRRHDRGSPSCSAIPP